MIRVWTAETSSKLPPRALTGTASAAPPRPVVIVTNASDRVASSQPAQWAIAELRKALDLHGIPNRIADRSRPDEFAIVVARAPSVPEASSIVPTGQTVTAAGTYALLELANQVTHTGSLARSAKLEEQPANRIRSIIRPFVSEVEDKAWFYDRDAWREYLTMLAANCFNRLRQKPRHPGASSAKKRSGAECTSR